MNPAGEPAHPGASGFVAAAAFDTGLTWHADPSCAGMVPSTRRSMDAPTLTDVALQQAAHGRLPCRRCAYADLLDDLDAHSEAGGYHYLICANTHRVDAAGCPRCKTLAAYGAQRHILVSRARGPVALLRPGLLPHPVAALFGMHLRGYNAHIAAPLTLTAPLWDAAASLLVGYTSLTEALTAAAGLYGAVANPGHRPGPAHHGTHDHPAR